MIIWSHASLLSGCCLAVKMIELWHTAGTDSYYHLGGVRWVNKQAEAAQKCDNLDQISFSLNIHQIVMKDILAFWFFGVISAVWICHERELLHSFAANPSHFLQLLFWENSFKYYVLVMEIWLCDHNIAYFIMGIIDTCIFIWDLFISSSSSSFFFWRVGAHTFFTNFLPNHKSMLQFTIQKHSTHMLAFRKRFNLSLLFQNMATTNSKLKANG